jgi:hypothetical protein
VELAMPRSIKAALISALWLAILSVTYADNAAALNYSLHPNNKSKTLNAILATGIIEQGDTDRLAAFMRKLPPKEHFAVYLASDGGDLYEGMRLGRFFKQNRIETVIEGGHDCASACALAFLGGTGNDGHPWRSSSTNSRLGFHAFRGGSEPPLTEDQVQAAVADMLAYGKTVNAPIELLIAGFATPSNDVFWVPQPDICALGIKLWSVETHRFVCN